MPTDVRVDGAAELARTLRTFARELGDLGDAGTAAGALVARSASMRARRRTGRLAASFHPVVTAGAVEIGSALVYAGVQEYGWRRRGITPSYALTSAFGDAESDIAELYAADIDRALAKVRGK